MGDVVMMYADGLLVRRGDIEIMITLCKGKSF